MTISWVMKLLKKAEKLAALDMKTLNALHNPDMIAGGNDGNDDND